MTNPARFGGLGSLDRVYDHDPLLRTGVLGRDVLDTRPESELYRSAPRSFSERDFTPVRHRNSNLVRDPDDDVLESLVPARRGERQRVAVDLQTP